MDYSKPENWVFVGFEEGYIHRKKILNNLQKQIFLGRFKNYIQVGRNCRDLLHIEFEDETKITMNPNKIPMNSNQFLSNRQIKTFWLEKGEILL